MFSRAAGVFLIFASFPALILISVVNIFLYKGKILFIENRIGLEGKSIYLYKFKSMTDQKDINGKLLADNQRITKFGNFLRKSSLDEFPSFINLVKGDINLVGPRPLPFKYRDRFSKIEFARHKVKPGITGLAQVNGRNSISWRKKFKYDLFYADKKNLCMDLYILIKTFKKVLIRDNINHADDETMPEFLGYERKNSKK